MENILIPTDFSANAQHAADFGVRLANKYGAPVHLITTYELTTHAGRMVSISEIIEEDAKQELAKEAARLQPLLKPGLEIHTAVYRGSAASIICEYAEQYKSDFIVMGTKGQHNIAERAFGSVATGVISDASCPVVVVPEGADFSHIEHIAYAVDLQELSDSAIDQLESFNKTLDTRLSFVHVRLEEDEAIEAPITKDARFVLLENDTVEEGLVEYINEEIVDLLAMYRPKRGFWKGLFHRSTTRRMVHSAQIPLLIFHDNE